MNDLLTGAAVALVLEGVCYALMPGTMRRLAARMAETPADRLRWAGLAGACIGVGLVWLARR
ncbi:DUF2065 domain-containing protein [Nitrospirillum sp. BR 11163]|uniref:DUF2065 domain-containing protein n=1 Tax=Nitrospirillum sp. BR 11163 TaxID=3104323 RepID=UPI002AFE81BD|nr:DUF2065 domain-containing protein [Nitrospirillum sp. BR 11163]MEA1675659.1 DUF2065 domain-containing protein [Nitrospirillum sp. BR 11163]